MNSWKKALLSVEEVCFSYPRANFALKQVSFAVEKGEVLGVIGPNGSGKSTLLRIASGIMAPSSGRVLALAGDLSALSRKARARILGYLPQQAPARLDFSVQEAVSMGRFPHCRGAGFLGPEDVAAVERAMEQADVLGLAGRSFSRLSGGERQRVLLASVLAQQPRVLLLDEPTSAMDIHQQVRFFRLVRKLCSQGLSAVVVTHDLNLASRFSHRLLLLKDGRVIQEGPPAALITQQVLASVYGEGIRVLDSPDAAGPLVVPDPGGAP
ncbi:MAG: ABC transporter ATP-binding protein [Deltaproteobacteria bacterium]|nr:ABC transporter ATP-binding protein [Deltaproteobacteria bacterium]